MWKDVGEDHLHCAIMHRDCCILAVWILQAYLRGCKLITNFHVQHYRVGLLLSIHDDQCAFILKGTFLLFMRFFLCPYVFQKDLEEKRIKTSFSRQCNLNNYSNNCVWCLLLWRKYNPSYHVIEVNFKQCTFTQLMWGLILFSVISHESCHCTSSQFSGKHLEGNCTTCISSVPHVS